MRGVCNGITGSVATPGLSPEHGELLLRGRTPHVERGHQHLLAILALDPLAQLRRGRRLAGALKPDHHRRDRRSRREVDVGGTGAQHLDQPVVDDLDHHLAGVDRAQHLLADRLGAGLLDELLDHGKGDIGLQEGDADFPHGGRDIGLGKRTAPLQAVEYVLEPGLQTVEHRCNSRPDGLRASARIARTGGHPGALMFSPERWDGAI